MACGVPALVSPGVNLAPEIGGAGAGWIVERSAPAIATALHEALTDGPARLRRGMAARRLAQPFRWTAVGRTLAMLYSSIGTKVLVGSR
jgi:glycosyltransferase involved in cell wall biosynthesis